MKLILLSKDLRRSFLILFGLNLIALAIGAPHPISIVQFAISCILSAIVIAIGLRAAKPFGRGTSLVNLSPRELFRSRLLQRLAFTIVIGMLIGGVILVMAFLLTIIEPKLSARLVARLDEPAWKPWFFAFQASIVEELFFHLFLMSGIIWVACKFSKKNSATSGIVWIGLIVSAAAFAGVHVISWFSIVQPTVLLISIVFTLNGLGAMVFGLVYWNWGIEAAIVCHFVGDMMVQALGPRLVGS